MLNSVEEITALIVSAWHSFMPVDRALILTAFTVIAGFAFSDLLVAILTGKKKENLGSLKSESRNKAEGILFGKLKRKIIYSPTSSEGHVAVIGGSGLGKTSALLIPTLRSWSGTSLTIDISGDISRNVRIKNKLVFSPTEKSSVKYNIFSSVDSLKSMGERNEALAQLAFLLMPPSVSSDDAAVYFASEGRKILIASFIAFYHEGMDFIPICEKIVGSSWRDLFTEIDRTKNEDAILYINSFAGANEKNTAGCKQACDAAITLFATNETIKDSLRRPREGERGFSAASLEDKNIFVIIPDEKLKLYAPLLHILTAQVLEHLSARIVNEKTKTVLLALDEFVSLGHLEITEALRKLRKKKVRILILTQSMADLDMAYGTAERMSMMTNFRYIVVLGANDSDTQEYISKLIGKHKVESISISINSKSTTKTYGKNQEYKIEPSELGHLGEYLILIYDMGYLKLKKNFYFK